MSKVSKIIVTVVIIVVFFLLFGAIVGIREDAGAHTPGLIGLIVFAGMIGAIRAIWKKDKTENDNNNQKQ